MILRPAKILGELSPQVQKLAPHFIGQCLNGVFVWSICLCLSGLSVILPLCPFVCLPVGLSAHPSISGLHVHVVVPCVPCYVCIVVVKAQPLTLCHIVALMEYTSKFTQI